MGTRNGILSLMACKEASAISAYFESPTRRLPRICLLELVSTFAFVALSY